MTQALASAVLLLVAVSQTTISAQETTPQSTSTGIFKPPTANPYDGIAPLPSIAEVETHSQTNLNLYHKLTEERHVPRQLALAKLRTNRLAICDIRLPCDGNRKYRSYDGTCNNLQHPRWGSAFREFNRLIPATYPDDYNQMNNPSQWSWPPASVPNARHISTALSDKDNANKVDSELTFMTVMFGQFIGHDMAVAPRQEEICCNNGCNCRGNNIEVPGDDFFYNNVSQPRQFCLDFARSTVYCFPTETGVREQFNQLTSFLDNSQVYGSSVERVQQLRSYSKGKLRTSTNNNNMLPIIQEIEELYGLGTSLEPFVFGKYLAGDDRVNENPALTALHILFMREHNRLADNIGKVFPNWTDEKVFQETRKLFVAEWQNMVYSEYLPLVLGPTIMSKYSLNLGQTFTKYKPVTDPTVTNELTAAAFRFGHTMVQGLIELFNGLRKVGVYLLRENFVNATQVDLENGVVNILGGLITQNSLALDQSFTEDLTNFLFKLKTQNFGSDLFARNIQRSRDHGLPPYNSYRHLCGLHPLPPTWANRPSEISRDAWKRLQKAGYSSPMDIDLFVGGISEDPIPEGIFGPIFTCIQAKAFQKVMDGDRFFFSHRDQIASLSPSQFAIIRQRKFADMICENIDIPSVTLNVFKVPSKSNPWISCKDPSRSKIDIKSYFGV